MKKFVFFCGPHCCGKTTLLKRLKEDRCTDISCDEIGKRLFYDRKLLTAEQGTKFEFEVTQLEMQRDQELYSCNGTVGIETWHPGNLAYAAVRNPSCVSELCKIMRDSPLFPYATGIRLTVSEENILRRTKTFAKDREWAVEFYKKIDDCLDECIVRLGLEKRIAYVSADNSIDDVLKQVKSIIIK